MREPSEMITVLRMQNMVEIRKKKHLFRDQIIFGKKKSSFGALGVESPHGGAITTEFSISQVMISQALHPS
jgi:hypothetical protein